MLTGRKLRRSVVHKIFSRARVNLEKQEKWKSPRLSCVAEEKMINFKTIMEQICPWMPSNTESGLMSPKPHGAYLKINFLISQLKHMLWVLKRPVSVRRFF